MVGCVIRYWGIGMIRSKGLFSILFIAVAVSSSVFAEMMDVPAQSTEKLCVQPIEQSAGALLPSGDFLATEFELWAGQSLPDSATDDSKEGTIQNVRPLTDRTSSLSLCLSALISFGLVTSARHIKRLHFGFVPDWYHDGGPFQIGHSYVLSPDCLNNTTVYCFIQPDSFSENSQHQLYRLSREIVSLWRKSQFTPESISSRGPPLS